MTKKECDGNKRHAELESQLQAALYQAIQVARKLGDDEKEKKILDILKSGF